MKEDQLTEEDFKLLQFQLPVALTRWEVFVTVTSSRVRDAYWHLRFGTCRDLADWNGNDCC